MRLMYFFSLLLCLVCGGGVVYGQTRLAGQVRDAQDGQPVAYASILVQEVQSGSVAGDDGSFSLDLPLGQYHLEVRCLGYESLRLTVDLRADSEPLQVKLRPLVRQLKQAEVRGRKGTEDPAYPIMRRVMYLTPIYRRAFERYNAQIYARTGLKLERVPQLMNVEIGDSKIKLKDLEGKTFVEEQISTVSYTSPNTFKHTIRSKRTSIPKALKEEMSLTSGIAEALLRCNFYGSVISGGVVKGVNPITPGAFGPYKYRLLSRTKEGDQLVYRIAFSPRTNDANIISGEIEVLDGVWAVRTMKLRIDGLGLLKNELVFQLSPIAGSVYLPTTLKSDLKANLLGMAATMTYVTSISYRDVVLSSDAQAVKQDSLSYTRLRNKDVDAHEAQVKRRHQPKTEQSAKKHRYERRIEVEEPFHSTVVDSLDSSIDSAYWHKVRPVPMKASEQESFIKLDSINTALTKKAEKRQKPILAAKEQSSEPRAQRSEGGITAGEVFTSLLFGGDLYDKAGWNVAVTTNGGVLNHLLYHYNVADQMQLGSELALNRFVNKRHRWSLTAGLYYATRRKDWLWNASLNLFPDYQHNLDIKLGAGRTTSHLDDAQPSGGQQAQFAFLAAISGLSSTPLYDREYANLAVSFIPRPELWIDTKLSLERSRGLDLSPVKGLTSSWFANSGYIGDNRWGDYAELQGIVPQQHRAEYLSLTTKMAWSTKPYHRRRPSGWLVYNEDRNLSPTYTLYARANVPVGVGGSSFGFVRLGVQQSIRLRRYVDDFVTYRLFAGGYLWRHKVAPEQAEYLKGYNSVLTSAKENAKTFFTMRPYTALDTPFFSTGQLIYSSNRIILNYLPFLVNRVTTEQLDFKINYRLERSPHAELGYLWGAKDFMELGVYFGGELSSRFRPTWAFMVRTSF